MKPTQARQLLLVRAHELLDPPPAAWTAADQAWASDEASRLEGEQASADQWLLRRAELACERLAQRDPTLAAVLQPRSSVGWWTAGLVLLALLSGLASDAVGPSRHVNLLAPPLLAVLLWNLLVYIGLALMLLSTLVRPRPQGSAAAWLPGPMQQLGLRLGRWMTRPAAGALANPALQRYAADRAATSGSQQAARLATALHLAAAAVAAGALGALYLRGLVFEFRAGWDSTFLDAETVAAWLTALLGPAAALTGLPLPDAAQLQALRFSQGPGENAARWIHLYAVTTAGAVLLPRLALAAWSAWRVRRSSRLSPLAPDDPWRRRLLQRHALARGGALQRVLVLPYSLQLGADSEPALTAALEAELGPGLALHRLPTVPLGGEDALASHWPDPGNIEAPPAVLVLVFALAATPERETHGSFLRAVRARCATWQPAPRCLVLLDEAGFRRRLRGADLATRLAQRRAAWQSLLAETGHAVRYAELGPRSAAEVPA